MSRYSASVAIGSVLELVDAHRVAAEDLVPVGLREPGETPVDNANTLFNDAYVVVDLRANYDINPNLSLYGEVRNVFDETYASSTLIVDTAQAGQAAFLPGDGRAFLAGLKGRF